MRKHKEIRKHSLLAAALLAVAIGPAWAGDTTQVEEEMYRQHLLNELRQNLKQEIESLSLERADIVRRIANQETAGARTPVVDEIRPVQPRRSSGATL
jgi:prophage antirepressor-like protein